MDTRPAQAHPPQHLSPGRRAQHPRRPLRPHTLLGHAVLSARRPPAPPLLHTGQPIAHQAALTAALQYLAHVPGATPLLVAQLLHPFLLTAHVAAHGLPPPYPPPLWPYLVAPGIHCHPASCPPGSRGDRSAACPSVPRSPHPFELSS
ncbi:hypothetical protein AB1Y20_013362 [Prymnesium parvum]|uniref:Uncharacterized protein n=1 Tax=Prymnesium parvum TaxID=97485 RepID=A0AB34IIW3_PRYPA